MDNCKLDPVWQGKGASAIMQRCNTHCSVTAEVRVLYVTGIKIILRRDHTTHYFQQHIFRLLTERYELPRRARGNWQDIDFIHADRYVI